MNFYQVTIAVLLAAFIDGTQSFYQYGAPQPYYQFNTPEYQTPDIEMKKVETRVEEAFQWHYMNWERTFHHFTNKLSGINSTLMKIVDDGIYNAAMKEMSELSGGRKRTEQSCGTYNVTFDDDLISNFKELIKDCDSLFTEYLNETQLRAYFTKFHEMKKMLENKLETSISVCAASHYGNSHEQRMYAVGKIEEVRQDYLQFAQLAGFLDGEVSRQVNQAYALSSECYEELKSFKDLSIFYTVSENCTTKRTNTQPPAGVNPPINEVNTLPSPTELNPAANEIDSQSSSTESNPPLNKANTQPSTESYPSTKETVNYEDEYENFDEAAEESDFSTNETDSQ